MSIKAMHWAWTLMLAPAPKFVLMALADHADDFGICWPHVGLLASKCCMSHRSVQRALHTLRSEGLLQVEAQFKRNGSQRSNHYRLAIDCRPGDKLTTGAPGACMRAASTSHPGDRNDTPSASRLPPPGDSGDRVTEEPSGEPSKEPEPQKGGASRGEQDYRSAASDATQAGALVLPSSLVASQRRELEKIVGDLDVSIAQEVLDELAGRLAEDRVRDPVRYCRALVYQVNANRFRPKCAFGIAETRAAASRAPAADQVPPSCAPAPARPMRVPQLPPDLQERVERMRLRALEKAAGAPDSDGNS